MKYKIGDIVRVRKDLKEGYYKNENGKPLRFVYPMLEFRGKEGKIIEIEYGDYRIEGIDKWWFGNEMLEPVYKEGDYVLVSNDNNKWVKKIFFRTFTNGYGVIGYGYEEEYLKGNFFDIGKYKYIKPIEEIKREIICTDEKWEEIQKILKLNK